jgi:hypothetical protein
MKDNAVIVGNSINTIEEQLYPLLSAILDGKYTTAEDQSIIRDLSLGVSRKLTEHTFFPGNVFANTSPANNKVAIDMFKEAHAALIKDDVALFQRIADADDMEFYTGEF